VSVFHPTDTIAFAAAGFPSKDAAVCAPAFRLVRPPLQTVVLFRTACGDKHGHGFQNQSVSRGGLVSTR
jgi:hypothetical protein